MLDAVIREGRESDFEAAAALQNSLAPFRVGSARDLLHRFRTEPEAARRRYWAACVDELLVGWATVVIDYRTAASSGFLSVWVAEEHRRRGLGSRLYTACAEYLAGLKVERIRTRSEADTGSRAFVLARGFRQTQTTLASGVRPGLVEAPEPPPGVELVPLGSLDSELVFALDREVSQDVPNEELDALELEQWRDDHWRHPDMDLDASTAALVDGRPVSYAFLSVAPDGRAVSDMTGTQPAYRGRGLAELVKRSTLAKAAERGVSMVFSYNDSTNAAILKVNEQLGYRRLGETHGWVRD